VVSKVAPLFASAWVSVPYKVVRLDSAYSSLRIRDVVLSAPLFLSLPKYTAAITVLLTAVLQSSPRPTTPTLLVSTSAVFLFTPCK
jgi:hypothetical protein